LCVSVDWLSSGIPIEKDLTLITTWQFRWHGTTSLNTHDETFMCLAAHMHNKADHIEEARLELYSDHSSVAIENTTNSGYCRHKVPQFVRAFLVEFLRPVNSGIFRC